MKFGRPPKFKKAEDLQKKIEQYFQNLPTKKVITGPSNNRQVEEIQVPTITGLCLFCGFESRQSFYDLEKNDEFSYTIKRARLLIENHYEELGQTTNAAFPIFALKNFNWQDKQVLASDEDEPMAFTLNIVRPKEEEN